jgi:hypothetical protein
MSGAQDRQSEFCCREDNLTCETCGSELVGWTGRIWFDRTPEGMAGAEHVEGPCPRCGHHMTERDPAADGSIKVGLWD